MTAPYYEDGRVTVHAGDCLDVLATLPDASVDAVVTDPPYGLEFMGKEWDKFAPDRKNASVWDGRRQAQEGWEDAAAARSGKGGGGPSYRSGSTYKGSKRCTLCGKRAFSGSPCECDEPEWVIEHREEAPSAMLGFQAWCTEWSRELYRVLKPGGHLLAFGGTRTSHRLACAIEDAGFEIRDSIAWLYGSGFPKSLDVSKAIDKAAGAERKVVGDKLDRPGYHLNGHDSGTGALGHGISSTTPETRLAAATITAPATPDAERWQGWGTALKPAHEPIVVARKPLNGTVAGNVLQHGTGALNIDGCRVAGDVPQVTQGVNGNPSSFAVAQTRQESNPHAAGRWPANVILDESQAEALDQQSGTLTSSPIGFTGSKRNILDAAGRSGPLESQTGAGYTDSGGASRFFYVAKADSAERPFYYRHSCECEDSWPTTSHARAIAATTPQASSSTSKSGSGPTEGECPLGTTSTTGTATNSTTTRATSNLSPSSSTSESTPAASSETVNGGSPAQSAASSSPSPSSTGTSAARDGLSTGAADRAISAAWSATSVCGECGAKARRECHATVKPLALMRWLVRLVTPPGGTVLEPFAGSGTTVEACVLEGFRCIAIEREADYLPLITSRLTQGVLDFGDPA